MKTRIAVVVLIVVALAVGASVVARSTSEPKVSLVPTWQLLRPAAYRAMQVTDPFVSWAPDSRSLLFSERAYANYTDYVFLWNVGETGLDLVTKGASPNFLPDGESFIYLTRKPARVVKRDLDTGREVAVMPKQAGGDEWRDVVGIRYDPDNNAIATRLTEFTEFDLAGTDLYDLAGNHIGDVKIDTDSSTMRVTRDPRSKRYAAIVKDGSRQLALQLRSDNSESVRTIATGCIGAADWSPDGSTIAYGSGADVVLYHPADGSKTIVGRFGLPRDKDDHRYVARLMWSPNSCYLAAMVYVPREGGDYPLIYVMDLSRPKRSRQ